MPYNSRRWMGRRYWPYGSIRLLTRPGRRAEGPAPGLNTNTISQSLSYTVKSAIKPRKCYVIYGGAWCKLHKDFRAEYWTYRAEILHEHTRVDYLKTIFFKKFHLTFERRRRSKTEIQFLFFFIFCFYFLRNFIIFTYSYRSAPGFIFVSDNKKTSP